MIKKENLEERLIVVLDIETTALRHDSGMIVEVGSCFLDLNSGKVSSIFSAVCKEELYIILKVQVFHPDSMRKSWQKWGFCKKHYFKFLADKGKDWYCWYNNEKKAMAPVIAFKEW